MSLKGINIGLTTTPNPPNLAGFVTGITEGPTPLGVAGLNVETNYFTNSLNNTGFNFDVLTDLVVSVETLAGDPILNPTYTVTNSAVNDSVNTKDYLFLTVAQSDTLDITASKSGFQDNTVSVSFTEGEPQRITIVLSEVEKINFTCTTLFKSADGVTVDKPLSNGYIEVTFSGGNSYDKANYTPYFEALPLGGSKYNSTVLAYEVLSQTVSSIVYKVDVVTQGGEFCYLSNYIKKQC